MTEANVAAARELYANFGQGNIPAVLGALDANIVWQETAIEKHPAHGTHHGPQAVLEGVFMQLGAAYDDFRVTPTDVTAAGDRVFVIGDMHGTGKTSGKTFDAPYLHVLTFADGKVTRFDVFDDTAAMIGVLE